VPVSLFRRAVPASTARNVAKTALQVALVWTAALYVGPLLLVALQRRMGWDAVAFGPSPRAGAALLLAASAAGLWSGWVLSSRGRGTPVPFDTTRELVVSGPYAHVRNPMAVTGVLQGLGVALLLGSWLVAGYSLAGGLTWQLVLRPAEERDMAAWFGAPYEAYRRSVPCWLPRLSRWRPPGR
jgi:protein-S-isoprenylcysteine O-methyltransferase Ste14